MIQLTIQVADIASVLLLYNTIYIYTSSSENGTYTFLDSIPLQTGVSEYTYLHLDGTSDTWYKSSYYNTGDACESSLSNAATGDAPTLYHNVTYPPEYDFDAGEEIIIRKIRRLIGDFKELERLWIEGSDICSDGVCSSVLEDGKTISLGEKGWPVHISINDVLYTTLEDPIVQGYKYLTFSGTLETLTSGCTGDVEIWYHTFKFSDREVYEAYGDAMIPPGVTSSCVTDDHLMLQASIDLLESMTAEDLVDDGALVRDDQTTYDPSPGLRERDRLLNRLRKQLDALVQECLNSSMLGLEGVLID